MIIDPQIHDRLHAAVDQDSAPPNLAALVVRRGRRRRAGNYAVAGLAAAVVIGAATAAVLLPGAPDKRNADTADTYDSALTWARSLPAGPSADLPYFTEEGLHDRGQLVAVPDDVIRTLSLAPSRVTGGWIVLLGLAKKLEPAVLAPDGTLSELPPWKFPEHFNDATVVVSDDGSQVAYGDRVLELVTRATTPIPHERDQQIRLVGFVEDGLVYQLQRRQQVTTWLLHPDGSAVETALPDGAYLFAAGRTADVAVTFPAPESEDECLVSYKLVDEQWTERAPDCGDRPPGQALGVSPGGRWVLTPDLPDVWNLEEGGFKEVDALRGLSKLYSLQLFTTATWESPDSFLIPVTDGEPERGSEDAGVDSAVQMVRCMMSTGDCEQAGEEMVVGSDSPLIM